jgi:methionyl-tRNA formyltransferase
MRIVFFGTPPFAAEILKHLLNQSAEIVAVVTKPDKPQGRSGALVPSAVKQLAQEKLPNVPLLQPAKISAPEYVEQLAQLKPDLFIVVAFGEIIKQALLDVPKFGCINIHASLLPKYRGAAPIQRAVMNGDPESGVTIMYMVKQMDAGDIIRMVRCPIPENMTAGELEQQLCNLGRIAIVDVIKELGQGIVKREPQDHSAATMAPKVELEDGLVDWNRTAREIHNTIRGLTPRPGSWCLVNLRGEQKRLKVADTSVVSESGTPGAILRCDEKGLIVACGKDSLCIGKVQLEGKKMVPAIEFWRGIQSSGPLMII